MTVSLQNEERVPIVEQIMERNGAIDIDERSATWNDDATPVTASTETLTTGYPDATSISVDERELNGTATPERGQDSGSIPGRAENEKPPDATTLLGACASFRADRQLCSSDCSVNASVTAAPLAVLSKMHQQGVSL